jgi:hypothetical protein
LRKILSTGLRQARENIIPKEYFCTGAVDGEMVSKYLRSTQYNIKYLYDMVEVGVRVNFPQRS